MTIILFLVAHSTRTPVLLWVCAMGCDTAIIMTYMLTKAAA
jgi:hypothetical protein